MSQITSFFPTIPSLELHGLNDEIAWIFGDEKLSYHEFLLRAEALASWLSAGGVRPRDLFAVLTDSSGDMFLMLCASLYLQATIFPLDPRMSGERRNRLLLQAGCSLVLTSIEMDNIPDGVKVIPFDFIHATDKTFCSGDDRGEVQLIVATSGSEGEPKGVMLSGANIAASVSASRSRLGLSSGDLWLNCLPMFHIGGVMIAYRCLDAGAGMLLHSSFDAGRVWHDLRDLKATHISLVPAMLAKLLDVSEDAAPPPSLRVALIGGGHLAPELASRAHAAGWPLCVSYGMSESCSQCATDCGTQAGLVSGHVGMPLNGFEIALSEQGRIMLRGQALMRGYVTPDLSPGLGLSDTGWFQTGDLGEIDAAGCLRVLGRADDVLISGGRNIHPGEIEDLMLSCSGVEEIAVTGSSDQIWGDLLVALYVGAVAQEDVAAWCKANIVSPLRPRRFVRVPELPRNNMGKLDRSALRIMADQA